MENNTFEKSINFLNVIRQQREERKNEPIILLERRQISVNNPAIAQLYIEFPRTSPPTNLKRYFLECKKRYSINANVHDITKTGLQVYIIEIRGVLPMYKWMEFFIKSFIRDFGKIGAGYKIEVKGFWDKYDNEVKNGLY